MSLFSVDLLACECGKLFRSMNDLSIHSSHCNLPSLVVDNAVQLPASDNSMQLFAADNSPQLSATNQPCKSTVSVSDLAGVRHYWTNDMCLLLIASYAEHEEKVNDFRYTSKQLFSIIADNLVKKGYGHVTGDMCNEKWRGLKKSYMKVKDSQAKSGMGKVTFKYLKEMDDILGKKPNVEPIVTFSSENSRPE